MATSFTRSDDLQGAEFVDVDPRGGGWAAPLWWTDGVGQADPSHLRLRRT